MSKLSLVLLCSVMGVAMAYPSGIIPKHPDGRFMYLNVPAHKQYEAGFNRGNDKHYISRFDQVKDHRFRTRVKWADAHDGHGEHYWEYNHAPKYHHEPVHKHPVEHHIPHVGPSYSEPVHDVIFKDGDIHH